jgi:hypothetical protein
VSGHARFWRLIVVPVKDDVYVPIGLFLGQLVIVLQRNHKRGLSPGADSRFLGAEYGNSILGRAYIISPHTDFRQYSTKSRYVLNP